jgi:3-oxoacyl-[acyl-carrier protein] reductase
MNIIVTGASRGIGFETVKLLAADPANKIIALARNKTALEKLKQECHIINANSVSIIAIDLAKENIKEKLIPQIQKQFECVDVLINNAGAIVNKPIEQINDSDIENVYNVNVFSVYKLIRDLIPLFKKAKRTSHIVNISSMGGVQGSAKFAGLSVYSSSKGALSILTECLAEELKDSNISVNCLALGSVQTEMLAEAFPGYKAALSANQMAAFVANFALTGHRHFNGKILPVSITTP